VGAAAGAVLGLSLGMVLPGVGHLLGLLVGGLSGSIVGAAVGAAVAIKVSPQEEEHYWRENFFSLPYAAGTTFEDYAPAFRFGWETRARTPPDRTFEEVEDQLARRWEATPDSHRLHWRRARPAVRDAWRRIEERHHARRWPRPHG
jgi:FMN phosphatase YigB (HAD superfamily)